MSKNQYRIAVIPGDGIGKEVVPAALTVLDAVCERHGINLNFDHFDFAACDYYEKHGQMMPHDWKDQSAAMMRFSLAPWAGPPFCPIMNLFGGR